MIKILHITPHMGGGVGNVISRLATVFDKRMSHEIILLERPIKYNFLDKLKESEVRVLCDPNKKEIDESIKRSDIVIVHWWHHPKTSKFLFELPQVPTRLIIWTHISNLTVPALDPKILLESTRVLFTTEASYDAEVFKDITNNVLKEKTGIVYGCGGFDDFPKIEHNKHPGFNVGYLGLIDFSKMHPEFIEFCNEIKIPEAKFILAGDAPARELLDNQVKEKKIKNQFIYTGYVEDTKSILSRFDVFGYPLMSSHTCTTENVILEAMAAEIPPVLLKQLTEKYIVQDGKTGFLVSSKEEYGRVMRYLYNNVSVRKEIGKNAREYVLNKYTSPKLLDSLYENCDLVMELPKKIINFNKYLGQTPAEWFMSCLGKDKNIFKTSFDLGIRNQTEEVTHKFSKTSYLLRQPNKSSAFHYRREFPEDLMIDYWSRVMEKELYYYKEKI